MTLDLAIIGAGAAGTYVAYHAALLKRDWSIALFERTNRVGGRLFTGLTDLQGANVELGGMRFHDGHHLVTATVDELGLATRPFQTSHADNRLFLRGHMTLASEGASPGAYASRRIRGRPPTRPTHETCDGSGCARRVPALS